LIKNSQPFGKKFQKTAGGDFFLTHTVDGSSRKLRLIYRLRVNNVLQLVTETDIGSWCIYGSAHCCSTIYTL